MPNQTRLPLYSAILATLPTPSAVDRPHPLPGKDASHGAATVENKLEAGLSMTRLYELKIDRVDR